MLPRNYSILLADDDEDDRALFEDALTEVCGLVRLTVVENGDKLMQRLKGNWVPDIIFLDLNMPLKNGLECLSEMKGNERLKLLPVVVVSTSSELQMINSAYAYGANYFIKKPGTYLQLKQLILKVLEMDWHKTMLQPPREQFVLLP